MGAQACESHHVQAAAVHQRRQLVQTHLGGVQHRLDLLQVRLHAGSTEANKRARTPLHMPNTNVRVQLDSRSG